jgi:hypothetical protein
MKTQEELHDELFKQTSAVENALVKLDKAAMILGHWAHEYVFDERPNPIQAAKDWTSMPSKERDIKSEQSCKWFFEYGLIIGFVDIVHDYVYESKKILEKVVYGEEENKGA